MDSIHEKSEHSSSSVIALAIKGNKKSEYVVQWALNKFVPEGIIIFKLIHVHAGIKGVPTPMGNVIPLSQVRNDIVTAFRNEVEWQTNRMLLPFKKLCEQRKVHVDVVILESDDVATAVAEEVAKGPTTKLVVGASSNGIFTRYLLKSNGNATILWLLNTFVELLKDATSILTTNPFNFCLAG
ncbi:putative rossmann-like alpha/beta/alpha sandwich protein [Lupinus albus]|uniref:Putative rossmann-like alpha/beta/alpha sandwich protein n=1 Tax=Lupinus albus TaxID=3870 RepID=A0A6A4QRZ2_LUPAL|nr:putative rossmann-like alpha/beta/alpha sandwich protein [Lupinus albus]